MDGNILISVIIPAYQAEKWINRCIDSVLEQTFQNFEVIIVDDGSTDKTGTICDKYGRNDTRIKVLHQSGSGVSKARNNGLGLAKGDYILFLDADDTIKGEMLATFSDEIKRNGNIDILICNFEKIFTDGVHEAYRANTHAGVYSEETLLELYKELMNSNLAHKIGTQLYSRKILDDVLFDEKYSIYEDVKFCLEAYSNAKNAIYVDKVMYSYYMDIPESLSYGYKKDYFEAVYSYYLELKEYIERKEIENKYKEKNVISTSGWYYKNFLYNMRGVLDNASKDKENIKKEFAKISSSRLMESARLFYKNNSMKAYSIKEKVMFKALMSRSLLPVKVIWTIKGVKAKRK